jgi:hypothetical protein
VTPPPTRSKHYAAGLSMSAPMASGIMHVRHHHFTGRAQVKMLDDDMPITPADGKVSSMLLCADLKNYTASMVEVGLFVML